MSKRVHILVVEDDQDLRETLMESLEFAGYSVTTAGDGADALTQLQASPRRPDLILLDLQMPHMDGVEFRREQLKYAALAEIPVAILTADAEGEQKAAALNVALLKKPLKLPHLLSAIPRLVRTTSISSEAPR
jgi:CheY-like chemotaxis protein